jgi:glucose-6-phosphate isomerase
MTCSAVWQALQAHRKTLADKHLRELFRADPGRFEKFSIEWNGMLLDYSKNIVTAETLSLLLALAREKNLSDWIERLFAGEKINLTEDRAVLHTALRNRSGKPVYFDGLDVMPDIKRVQQQMREFCDATRAGSRLGHTGKPFTDVINIGIGGSDLGPLMVAEALKPYTSRRLRPHFVSNVDGTHLAETLKGLSPETTLFIVTSKTFTTQETLANARSARQWLISGLVSESAVASHFVAVSAHVAEARKFGIAPENVFEFWDWVGGRYSLWSAVGLPIALAIGMENFDVLLDGAHAMDEHFASAPLEANMPVIFALLNVWYCDFFGAQSRAVLPYDQYLHRFPAYLQQLEMESNGKRVTNNGEVIDYATAPVVWGEPGTNGQHAFFQLLHQGTALVPADFIVPVETHNPMGEHHAMLIANCFAQTEALMHGKTESEARAEMEKQGLSGLKLRALLPHKVFPGNRPSNTILVNKVDPKTLGSLIALYEHKVYAEGVIWNINSFDQWGVELGKQLANKILPELADDATPSAHDASTSGLINWYKTRRGRP